MCSSNKVHLQPIVRFRDHRIVLNFYLGARVWADKQCAGGREVGICYLLWEDLFIQGGFFNWSALKMTKCQITFKSLQKSSKCQNFLRVWHLVIFRADQSKKPPCINNWGEPIYFNPYHTETSFANQSKKTPVEFSFHQGVY